MKIEVTLGEILAHGDWQKYCAIKGLNEWCLNEGLASSIEHVQLTVEELETFGMLQYVVNNTNKVHYVPT